MKPGTVNDTPQPLSLPPDVQVERLADLLDLMATRYGWRQVFRALRGAGEKHSSRTVTAVADTALHAFQTHIPPHSPGTSGT